MIFLDEVKKSAKPEAGQGLPHDDIVVIAMTCIGSRGSGGEHQRQEMFRLRVALPRKRGVLPVQQALCATSRRSLDRLLKSGVECDGSGVGQGIGSH